MDQSRRASALLWAVPAAVLCGAGIATQSRINGALGSQLGDGFVAALFSFASGLVILSIALLIFKRGREGLSRVRVARAAGTVPWWHLLGGAAGAIFVLSQGLTSAPLGVALFSVGVVGGQTIGGVVIDRSGIGTMAPRPITVQRAVGGVLALAAVAIAGSSEMQSGPALWLLVLPVIAGFAIAWQQAVNGQIRTLARSALAASFINFLVGATLLGVVVLVRAAFVGWPIRFPPDPVLYLGGAIGVTFLALGTVVVGVTGVLLLALGTISGQLLMSLVLDLVLPTAAHPVQWTTFVGIGLALCAVVIVALSARAKAAKST